MNVAAIFLHNMRTQPCPAWIFCGDGWTEDLKKKANDLFSKYMKFEQFPSFNYWKLIICDKKWVFATRFTWESGELGGTWEKLARDLDKYYDNQQLNRT